MVNKYLRNGNN